jgi:hypothetical protein
MLNVRDAKTKDGRQIINFLKDKVIEVPSNKELKQFITYGYCKLLVQQKSIKGVILAYKTEERNVIAFFYIEKPYRGRTHTAKMFSPMFAFIDHDKPIHIVSDDISTFKNRVKHIEDNLYEWIGFDDMIKQRFGVMQNG